MSLHTLATLLLIKYFPTILSACKSITFSEMVFYFLEMPIEPIEIKLSHRLTEDKTTTSKNCNKNSSVLFMNECQKKEILVLALKLCFLFLVENQIAEFKSSVKTDRGQNYYFKKILTK